MTAREAAAVFADTKMDHWERTIPPVLLPPHPEVRVLCCFRALSYKAFLAGYKAAVKDAKEIARKFRPMGCYDFEAVIAQRIENAIAALDEPGEGEGTG